jgi:hypothetical protein
VIVEKFDSGLRHPTAPSPIEADLGDLAPGQSRQVTATFQVIAPGQQCNTVDVIGEGGIRTSGRACLNGVPSASPQPTAPYGGPAAVPAPVPYPTPSTPGQPMQPPPVNTPPAQQSLQQRPIFNVRKTGPVRKAVGEEADFVIDITNVGTVAATNLKIADNYDLALDPIGATDGHRFVGNDIVWIVDTLPPNKSIRFQVNCKCVGRADKACNRVTVTSAEGAPAGSAEACLEIVAVQSTLAVTINDTKDPVQAGTDVAFTIQVTNNAQAPDTQVQIAVTLPPELQAQIVGNEGPTQARQQGAIVYFDPIASLPAGQTVTYNLTARALRAGTVQTRAEARSTASPTPQAALQSTTIF